MSNLELQAAQQRELSRRNKKKSTVVLITLFILLVVAFYAAMGLGKYEVSPIESLRILLGKRDGVDAMALNVVFGLRLPRILASMVCGAALAMSGATYQGVFKNPLISPDFLGVTQGACVGAAIGILLGLGSASTQLFAFMGGLAAVLLALAIPFLMRSRSNLMLVLSGIIVGGAMSSILGFLKYIADPMTQLASITYWQMGSFAYVEMAQLLKIMPLMVLSGVLLAGMSWRIDILSLGEQEAHTLGTNVGLIRNISIVCATFLTASAVCISGSIGWVGLVIPHFARLLVGSSYTKLVPGSCLMGALFMLVVDTVTRLFGPAEMPISILTGLIGAPFYAWLLYKRRNTVQ